MTKTEPTHCDIVWNFEFWSLEFVWYLLFDYWNFLLYVYYFLTKKRNKSDVRYERRFWGKASCP